MLKKYWELSFLLLLLIVIPLPVFEGFGQIENRPTVQGTGGEGEGVFFVNTHPFSYKDEGGYTVVLGEIINNHDFPISDVKILVNFYNNISDEPIDRVTDTTILNSIPGHENSPFMLKSSIPNSAISRVGVTLLGFDSSPEKPTSLSIKVDLLEITNSLNFSGIITNNGNEDATDIKIHLISTDIFDPPRIVSLSSINFENPLIPGNSQIFSINDILNSKSVNYYILAESDNFHSHPIIIDNKKIISQNKIITINDVTITNIKQDESIIFSPIQINAQILMQEFTSFSLEENYVFYVQIRNAESGLIEFIGSSSSILQEDLPENPSIIWIPENEGLFFIETYLWNTDNVTLSSPGEILLVNINSV